MSKENKATTYRPKVRFSHPLSEKSTSENIKSSVSETIISKKKPRVRSVINLDDKSKILYNKNGNSLPCGKISVENENVSSSSEEDSRKVSVKTATDDIDKPISFSNAKRNDEKQSADRIDKIIKSSGKDDKKISSVENNVKEIKETKNNLKIDKMNICSSKISKIDPSVCKKLANKSGTVRNNGEISKTTTTNRKDKPSNLCFGRGLTTTTTTTTRSLSCSKNVKPCIKTLKTRSKNSPVKKTLLRNVSVSSTNVYVGPGLARYYPQTFREKDVKTRREILSADKLSRPEYNSIICTIEELKKVESENFVTDVDHLPIFYKNLVNEKVSAALDFPPDEAIFKNLIDISVSEDQLPSRFTRSKDPEPRNRDVSPRLSDFFNPSYSEEYCSAVNIRPVIQDVISNWSAFVISDKIFGWKHDMDQCS